MQAAAVPSFPSASGAEAEESDEEREQALPVEAVQDAVLEEPGSASVADEKHLRCCFYPQTFFRLRDLSENFDQNENFHLQVYDKAALFFMCFVLYFFLYL